MVARRTSGDVNSSTDQRVLRSLLKRSAYATADLEALEGPDQAREHIMIGHITDGMIMADGYPASRRRVASLYHVALLRWEDEGGRAPAIEGIEASQPEDDDGEV
jgi:hypothetical protein